MQGEPIQLHNTISSMQDDPELYDEGSYYFVFIVDSCYNLTRQFDFGWTDCIPSEVVYQKMNAMQLEVKQLTKFFTTQGASFFRPPIPDYLEETLYIQPSQNISNSVTYSTQQQSVKLISGWVYSDVILANYVNDESTENYYNTKVSSLSKMLYSERTPNLSLFD